MINSNRNIINIKEENQQGSRLSSFSLLTWSKYPAIYMFKVYNRNIRKMCEICSKLKIKTPERRRRRSGVFIVNFEYISHLLLVFLLLTLNN